jgi:predicted dehydrogenase
MSGRLFHAPFLQMNPGFELYSVLERSKDLAKTVYPSIRTCRSLDELLGDGNVELVIVNTPNYSHYEYAKKALQAGKHVVVEKPFVVTVAEGEELARLAREKGRLCSVFQNRRWDSDFRTVRQIIDDGSLGKIVEAELHYDRYTPALSPKLHKETPGPGTGVVYDLGPHLIDQALQLFGMPEAVFADVRVLRADSKVDDYMELLLFYPELRVRLKASYFVREPLPAYNIYGMEGTFHKSRADPQERQLLAGEKPGTEGYGIEPETEQGLLHTEKDGKLVRGHVPTQAGNYAEYYAGICGAIREGRPLPVTAEDGTAVIRVIEGAYKSVKNKAISGFQY